MNSTIQLFYLLEIEKNDVIYLVEEILNLYHVTYDLQDFWKNRSIMANMTKIGSGALPGKMLLVV